MAITTYAELQTSVANWLARADLDSYIPDFITLGETRIMREVRARSMETAFSDTIASGAIALPTSYIELKYAYVNTAIVSHLKRREARFIYEKYPTRSAQGEPTYIAREGSNFIFGPYPDSNYPISGVYYKNIGPVSSSAHALFTENPDLYLFATLAETVAFTKNDKRIPLWESKYTTIKNDVNGLAEREDFSGSDLQMRPG
jgi:hypothetical protein